MPSGWTMIEARGLPSLSIRPKTALAVGSDADGGLRGGVGVEQHDAGDAVGETDLGARLAVVAVDAESGCPVGADAEASAQGSGAVEDRDLRDSRAGDIELTAGFAMAVDEHELLRRHHPGRGGCCVYCTCGEDMA